MTMATIVVIVVNLVMALLVTGGVVIGAVFACRASAQSNGEGDRPDRRGPLTLRLCGWLRIGCERRCVAATATQAAPA